MRRIGVFVVVSLAFTVLTLAQDEPATFKTEARSTFVWGEDAPSGAISWRIKDPLTGTETFKLRYAGIEVSSRMGFEKLRNGQVGEFIGYTTTIVNNTTTGLSVKPTETTLDGHIVSLLSVVHRSKESKRNSADTKTVKIDAMYCFLSKFLSDENVFPVEGGSPEMTVRPKGSLTFSSVIRDQRPYPMLCSVDGCLPKGTIRYSIQVGSHDYIFIWPGRSIVSCGR